MQKNMKKDLILGRTFCSRFRLGICSAMLPVELTKSDGNNPIFQCKFLNHYEIHDSMESTDHLPISIPRQFLAHFF